LSIIGYFGVVRTIYQYQKELSANCSGLYIGDWEFVGELSSSSRVDGDVAEWVCVA